MAGVIEILRSTEGGGGESVLILLSTFGRSIFFARLGAEVLKECLVVAGRHSFRIEGRTKEPRR